MNYLIILAVVASCFVAEHLVRDVVGTCATQIGGLYEFFTLCNRRKSVLHLAIAGR